MDHQDYQDELHKLSDKIHNLKQVEADICSQLATAVAAAKETGRYANPVWFQKAKTALRVTRADIDNQQRALSLLKMRYGFLRQDSVESKFVEVAKEQLTPDVFTAWLKEATTRTEENLQ